MENRSSYNSHYFNDDEGKSLQVKQIIPLYFQAKFLKQDVLYANEKLALMGGFFGNLI